tara:strand:+ start:79872 stop:80039 length:168 start_codon:yes stop_codon:yes gene_type:complete
VIFTRRERAVFINQNAGGGAVWIVKLARSGGPQECDQANQAHAKRDGDEKQQARH